MKRHILYGVFGLLSIGINGDLKTGPFGATFFFIRVESFKYKFLGKLAAAVFEQYLDF